MATVSYDEQSVIIDGRRAWLVSGAVHYARTPRAQWRSRLRAAKQAGLNCIDVRVYWHLHEPTPAQFNFEQELDLRHFIELIAQEGLHCVLRPGPYLGDGRDLGGLPPWLLGQANGVKLRQADGPFLEACSRYLGAVMEQVKDLQATSSNGGPILLAAVENRWFCGHRDQAKGYLGELARYLRENGCAVPLINCNNLWPGTDETIACWHGTDHLAADLRQLGLIQPHAPRIADLETTEPCFWSQKKPFVTSTPSQHLYRLASVLASAGQYNDAAFHGAPHWGFDGGRSSSSRFAFAAAQAVCDPALSQTGQRGDKYQATKRISVFASQFGQVLAHLNSADQHAALAVDGGQPDGPAVVHLRGSQGQTVFLFKSEKDKRTQTSLLLPNGLTLDVPLGTDTAAWLLLDADLSGVAKLNYTNLRPWAFFDRQALVLFGPAGAQGLVCINNALLRVKVPTGKTPAVERHEDLTVIVLNTAQVDAAYLSPAGLVVGAAGLDSDDKPIPLQGWGNGTLVAADGPTKRLTPPPAKRVIAPKRGKWEQAPLTDLINADSDRFEPIEGPVSLESLGCPTGYGWYKLSLKSPVSGKALAAESADRLHVYQKGKLEAVLGVGPAAQDGPTQLRLADDTVILADNLGHASDGWAMDQSKGLFGHIYTVKPLKLTKPKIIKGQAPDLFALSGFFPYAHSQDRPVSDALSWKIKPVKKNPLICEIDGLPWRCVLMANGEPVGAYDPALSGGFARFVLHVGQTIKGGANDLRLALFDQYDPRALPGKDLSKHVRLYQATLPMTAKAQWSFAKWTLPGDNDFKPVRKSKSPGPCWYRCNFQVSHTDAPLWLEPTGMTKGQIYINGHNAGRYFVATHTGQAVPPQRLYYLPEGWLHTDRPNELLLFDEHGRPPAKCRLVYSR